MPVRNIECQLAQGQLNRYMGGDGLSESALEQLEAHIRECEDCGIYLDEKKRALQAMIEPQAAKPAPVKPQNIPTHAVVMFPDDEPKPVNTFMATLAKKRAALDQAVRPATASTETTRSAATTPNSFIKPLLYSLGLAAILIGMSALMRDPTRLLGDRVAKTNPEAAIATPPEKKSEPANDAKTETITTNAGANEKEKSALASNPTVEPETQSTPNNPPATTPRTPVGETKVANANRTTTNSIKAPAKPRTTTNARRARRDPFVARRPTARKPKLVVRATSPKPKATGIKVYDDNGTQISE